MNLNYYHPFHKIFLNPHRENKQFFTILLHHLERENEKTVTLTKNGSNTAGQKGPATLAPGA